jgi:pre-mRNA-splicing factor SYF2
MESKGESKKEERLKRLQQLRLRQNEARKLNHKEVVEEDRKSKLPQNWEKQKERIEYEEEKEKKRKSIEEKGLPFDRVQMLDWTADECDTWDRKKMKKHNPDTGFADYEQASFRQYERLTKEIKPDMDNYERQKDEM